MIEIIALLKPLWPVIGGGLSVLSFILGIKIIRHQEKKKTETAIQLQLIREAQERERDFLLKEDKRRKEVEEITEDISDSWDMVTDMLLKRENTDLKTLPNHLNGSKVHKPKK